MTPQLAAIPTLINAAVTTDIEVGGVVGVDPKRMVINMAVLERYLVPAFSAVFTAPQASCSPSQYGSIDRSRDVGTPNLLPLIESLLLEKRFA